MSYSRWSNSVWYTYWLNADHVNKNEEIFVICDFLGSVFIKYLNMKKIKVVMDKLSKKFKWASKKQLKELKGYILEFKKEVEYEYKDRE